MPGLVRQAVGAAGSPPTAPTFLAPRSAPAPAAAAVPRARTSAKRRRFERRLAERRVRASLTAAVMAQFAADSRRAG